jgi:ATP-dependent Lon protease
MIEKDDSSPVAADEIATDTGSRRGRRSSPVTLPSSLPILPLKNTVVFPQVPTPLAVGRPSSVQLIDDAMLKNKLIGLVTQRNADVEEPLSADLYEVGTVALIHKLLKFPDGTLRILVTGQERIRIRRFAATEPYFVAEVEALHEVTESSVEMEALTKNLQNQITRMLSLMPIASDEMAVALLNVEDPGRLADLGTALLVRDAALKQEFLETLPVMERLRKLTRHISHEIEVMELGSKIQEQVQNEMEKGQREFVLRQQLKAIQKELGVSDDAEAEIQRLQEEIEKAGMPDAVKEAADRELKRLRTITPASAEYVVVRTYLDWLLVLPWSRKTQDKIDIAEARRILDEDHFDLDKVKDRILEFLAVRKLKNDSRGPILCFVGPPGTGKTSLGRSIARAMGRSFHRLSLGGMRDEAEIRGHRRTYVGALPGRIIEGLRKCGAQNPVFMLDEIDKLGVDFRGDPASALLEVLDPEQNVGFVDNYLDLPFDLSSVMFITTANVLETIPPALRDRMEVLELPGYTSEEKMSIARRYLIRRQCAENGISQEDVVLEDAGLMRIITLYTQEAGLRNLEREIAKICRKLARRRAEGETGRTVIGPDDLIGFLGPERFTSEVAERIAQAGVAMGLAWTPFGGQILFVEATSMPGGKSLTITGQIGDVMRESAMAALSFIRSRAKLLGIPADFFTKSDLHLHVPAGAIPKDGPSAGVTMAAALTSLLTGRPCRPDTAMTGEITLRGKVLPVGGLKEKVLAARRAGIKTIIMPADNEKDLLDLPKEARDALHFHFAGTVDEVLEAALQPASHTRRPAMARGGASSSAKRRRGASRSAPRAAARPAAD